MGQTERRRRHPGLIAAVDTDDFSPRKGPEMTKFSAFLKDDAGAVTVDWVVLTAAIVVLGLIVFNFVRPAVSNLAEGIGTELGDAQACLLADDTITC